MPEAEPKPPEAEPKPTELKVILFKVGLLIPTLTGEKQIILRRYRSPFHDLTKGEIFIGRFEEGLDILLVASCDTEVKTFKNLTDDEAQQDGFADAIDALLGMRNRFYPDLTPESECGIIRFEIPMYKGVPMIKLNGSPKSIIHR